MKTISDIFSNIKFGNVLLVQRSLGNSYTKPELICVVGVDVWDMAMTIYYVNYKSFEQYCKNIKKTGVLEPEIFTFPEWMDHMNVLGHWKGMPSFNLLLKSYRKQVY
jgi:hypothetical protein